MTSGHDDDDLPSLVDGVRSGRPASLERLVARVHARVREWAGRFTDDSDAADDVAQDVLIGLERRVRKFRGDSRFSTWLFAVTRNVALSRRRKDQRRASIVGREAAQLTAGDSERPHDLDAAALGELVLRYFDALPTRQREIFEFSDIRGWTPAEIARELRMEPSTVRAHLFKARRTIRARILENHERLLKEYTS
ncbi:MAG: sigma-70 family RNA polymerase sigma factor [Gemmatimonadaceae bacterium]